MKQYNKTILIVMALLAGLFAATSAAHADMIALNWQFNGDLNDASASGIDGEFSTYAGGVWTSGTPTYTSGVFGSAIDMNDLQRVRNAAAIGSGLLPTAGTDAWTVNIWTSRQGASSTGHVCLGGFGSDPSSSLSTAGAKRFLRIRSNTSSTPNALSLWGNSSGWDYDTTTPYPSNEDWHMFTASFAGGGVGETLTLYLDGNFVGSVGVVKAFNDTPGAGTLTVQAGSQTGTTPSTEYDGLLDDFSIWNVGLTAGEVKAISNVPDSVLPNYDSLTMEKLIGVFRNGGTQTVGDLVWEQAAGLTGNAGDIWEDGGTYYVQMDGAGNGVQTIPEPSALILLLGALGCWAARRRF